MPSTENSRHSAGMAGTEHAEQAGSIELDLQCASVSDGELAGVGHPKLRGR